MVDVSGTPGIVSVLVSVAVSVESGGCHVRALSLLIHTYTPDVVLLDLQIVVVPAGTVSVLVTVVAGDVICSESVAINGRGLQVNPRCS